MVIIGDKMGDIVELLEQVLPDSKISCINKGLMMLL
jgi:hypothetical protein